MYTTDALVCGSYDRNGADRTFLLYTASFGMIYATARSVREERSRQRHALQECTLLRVSLVKGKGGWRIGSVVSGPNVFLAAGDRATRTHVIRIIRMVRRFVRGEDANPELYTLTTDALATIQAGQLEHPAAFVDAVVYRMLYVLGYVAPSAQQRHLVTAPLAALDQRLSASDAAALTAAVNDAAAVSQL